MEIKRANLNEELTIPISEPIHNRCPQRCPQPSSDEETEDGGSECVICMCDVRDTLILPCRHLCLCNSCADSLRYQANNCPICRAPFRALLQIRALQRSVGAAPAPPANPPDVRPPLTSIIRHLTFTGFVTTIWLMANRCLLWRPLWHKGLRLCVCMYI